MHATSTEQRPFAHTLSEAIAVLQQKEQISPVDAYIHDDIDAKRAAEAVASRIRLPLGTSVQIRRTGVYGVINAHAVNDTQRYEVRWFDRHFFVFRTKWMDRGQFAVTETALTSTEAEISA